MTLKSWKEEFYPTGAEAFEHQSPTKQKRLEATNHSLVKWLGLTPENLKKHGVEVTYYHDTPTLSDGVDRLEINSESCALCVLEGLMCSRCPTTKATGRNCDGEARGKEDIDGPYTVFREKNDPQPMINVLKLAKVWCEEQLRGD